MLIYYLGGTGCDRLGSLEMETESVKSGHSEQSSRSRRSRGHVSHLSHNTHSGSVRYPEKCDIG